MTKKRKQYMCPHLPQVPGIGEVGQEVLEGLKRVWASRLMGGSLLPQGINSPTPIAPQTIALETKKNNEESEILPSLQLQDPPCPIYIPPPLTHKDPVASGQIPMVPEKAVGPY